MKRKRKFNFLKFIVFLLSIYLLYFIITFAFNIKTKNIIIHNNNYYSDEKIIETAKIEDYPKFIVLSKSKIKKRLLKLELIESVKVTKELGFIINIDVKEKKILYLNKEKNKYKCSDNKYYELNDVLVSPTLINYVPEDIENKFVNSFKNIDNDIIEKVSEIEYSSASYDKERFVLYMNDGNQVYINIKRMNNLNKYVSIVKKLNNKKGILYLDSGNYFEVKE